MSNDIEKIRNYTESKEPLTTGGMSVVNKNESSVDSLYLTDESYICGINDVLTEICDGLVMPAFESNEWYKPAWSGVNVNACMEFNMLDFNFILGDIYSVGRMEAKRYVLGKVKKMPPVNMTIVDTDKCWLEIKDTGEVEMELFKTFEDREYIGCVNVVYPTSRRFSYTGFDCEV